MLPQELSIFPDLTVAENIMLSALPTRRAGPIKTLDARRMRADAAALLKRMGLDWLSPDARMGALSHHVQRIVEIARALAGNARVLIMDEPTAALAEAEVQLLFSLIRRLGAEGVAVVYISHYLKEVFAISDSIAVLRDGRNAGTFTTANTDMDAVLEAMLGNRVGDIYPPFADANRPTGETVVVRGLAVPGWVRGIDFTVRRGEITGMHGLVGSGVEMVGRALFGAVPRTTITGAEIDGRPYLHWQSARRRGVRHRPRRGRAQARRHRLHAVAAREHVAANPAAVHPRPRPWTGARSRRRSASGSGD